MTGLDISDEVIKIGKGILKGAFDPVVKGVKIGVAGVVLVGGVYAGYKAVQAIKGRTEKNDDDNDSKKTPGGKTPPWDPKRKR